MIHKLALLSSGIAHALDVWRILYASHQKYLAITVFTSWKEIAAYLGKGVRTAQRWERELGLPVRHPMNGRRNIVIAVCDEIDAWKRGQGTHVSRTTEINRLQDRINILKAESEQLKQEIAASRLDSGQGQLLKT